MGGVCCSFIFFRGGGGGGGGSFSGFPKKKLHCLYIFLGFMLFFVGSPIYFFFLVRLLGFS